MASTIGKDGGCDNACCGGGGGSGSGGAPGHDGVGNPVTVSIGNKYQFELDYRGLGVHPLELGRHYNSTSVVAGALGEKWRHTYERSVTRRDDVTVSVSRADSKIFVFLWDGSQWIADADVHLELIEEFSDQGVSEGWRLRDTNNVTERYDVDGRLVEISDAQGFMQTLSYSGDGRLETVADARGQTLSFSYDLDTGQLSEVVTPVGSYHYEYLPPPSGYSFHLLGTVVQPDDTLSDDSDNPRRSYHYNESAYTSGADLLHALTGITDERGIRYATYEYDAEGRAIATYHADNADRVDIEYHDDGTRTVTNSLGVSTTYRTTSQLGRSLVTEISGPGCSTCGASNTTYEYDAANNLTAKVENGLRTEYGDYDDKGQYGYKIEAVGTAEERRTDYTYDARFHNKPTTITRPSVYANGQQVTSYTYDDFGNRLSQTINGHTPDGTPVSRITTYTYSGPFNQLSHVDGPRTDVSDIARYHYYPDAAAEGHNRARLRKVVDALGVRVRGNIQYTATGQIASEERASGLTLAYTHYPGSDRLETLSETDPATGEVRTTRWTYLATGEVETLSRGYGTAAATLAVFTYDDARRLIRISDGLGNAIHFTLDTEGNFTTQETFDTQGVLRESLSQTFDLYNRLDQFTQVHGDRDLDFAADGTLDRETNGAGTVTDYSYDALQRLTQVVEDAEGLSDTADTTTTYDYDIGNRLISVTDPKGNATVYEYDDLGNLLSQTSPDTGTTTYSYDAAGNLLSQTNALGQLTQYSYDALNRLVEIRYADDRIDTYTYATDQQPRVRLSQMSDGVSSTAYSYNAFGQLTTQSQTVDAVTLSLSYGYNAAGQLEQITYPSGRIATLQYNQGLLTALHLDGQAIATDIAYHPFGPPQSWTWGNGSLYARSYGLDGRVTSYPLADSPLHLSYNDVGDLVTQTDTQTPGNDQAYGYDARSQLRDYNTAATTQGYTYDANGNRSQHDIDNQTYPYSVEAQSNRLLTVAGPDARAYTLDAIGNTIADGVHSYSYDAAQRLSEVDGQHSYAYNGFGQRLRKITQGQTTHYSYDESGRLLGEYDSAGQVIREYLYLGNQPLATWSGAETASPALDFTSYPLVTFVRSQDQGGQASVEDSGAAVRLSGNAWKQIDLAYTVTPQTVLEFELTVVQGGEIHAIGLADSTSQTSDKAFNLYGSDSSWGLLTYAGQYTQEGSTVSYRILVGQHYTGAMDRLFFINDHDVAIPTAEAVFSNVRIYEDITGADTPHYIYTDHLNTPRAISDDSGTVVWRWSSDPFGAAQPDQDPDGNGQAYVYNGRFPGQYYDQETGLHYNYFRYYDPSTGRYITSDPIGLDGGLNTYGYAYQNPVINIDPDGLFAFVGVIPFIGGSTGVGLGGLGTTIGIGVAVGIGASAPSTPMHNQSGDRSRGRNPFPDPVSGLKPFNPGKDCDGKCNPCPPPEIWETPGDAHGSSGGSHYHGIVWNQDPATCMCYPKRVSGPSSDSLR